MMIMNVVSHSLTSQAAVCAGYPYYRSHAKVDPSLKQPSTVRHKKPLHSMIIEYLVIYHRGHHILVLCKPALNCTRVSDVVECV